MTDTTQKYLTFALAEESYAININSVREIRDISNITRVPRMPDYMRGVVNLRGSAVPVFDLRRRFGLPPTEHTLDTRIVVIENNINDETSLIGALADSVSEVLELEDDAISPPPDVGLSIDGELITGLAKQGEQFIMILKLSKVFGAYDPEALDGQPH